MPGLVPGIHGGIGKMDMSVDRRDKPGDDAGRGVRNTGFGCYAVFASSTFASGSQRAKISASFC